MTAYAGYSFLDLDACSNENEVARKLRVCIRVSSVLMECPKGRGFDSQRGQANFSACPRCGYTLRVTSNTFSENDSI